MNTATVGVRKIRYNGDKYGGAAMKYRHGKKGPAVVKGVVSVLSAESERRVQFGLRGIRAKKEDVGDISRIKWFEKYNPPKGVILNRKTVTTSLKAIRHRRPDFRLALAERFAEAVRKHFDRHRISQCFIEVLRKGCYPLNTDVGVFLEARVSGERFVIPIAFLPMEVKPKPKHK